jgi:hypothetical protein
MSALYVVIVLVAVFAMATLAMDYGRVQLAKTQLRIAVDCSAKYAVQWVTAGSTQALARANAAAADNKVDGNAISFASTDVSVGYWNGQTRVFDLNARPRNAVRITSTATIPLALGRVIGKETSRVRAGTVVSCTPMSIVGLSGVTFKNNTLVASYDSNVQKNPNVSNYNSNATILSNGYIGDQNNGTIKGDVITGPSGSVDPGFSVSGASSKLSTAIAAPPDPAWNPSSNPGGQPQNNYTHGNNSPLPAGTYWFTGTLRLNAKLRFNGATTIYVNGDIDQRADIEAYQQTPGNLKLYVLGAGRTWTTTNDVSTTAQVIAPRCDLTANNGLNFYGACIFNTITTKNNAEFYFDENLGTVANVAIVQ